MKASQALVVGSIPIIRSKSVPVGALLLFVATTREILYAKQSNNKTIPTSVPHNLSLGVCCADECFCNNLVRFYC